MINPVANLRWSVSVLFDRLQIFLSLSFVLGTKSEMNLRTIMSLYLAQDGLVSAQLRYDRAAPQRAQNKRQPDDLDDASDVRFVEMRIGELPPAARTVRSVNCPKRMLSTMT